MTARGRIVTLGSIGGDGPAAPFIAIYSQKNNVDKPILWKIFTVDCEH